MTRYIAKYSIHYVYGSDGKPAMMSTKTKANAHRFASEPEATEWGRKLFGKDYTDRISLKIIPVRD